MKLEIIMITSGRDKYFELSKRALENQTFKDFKLTIYDNKENESLASITSRLFLASDAELVGKTDDDFLLPPDYLEKLVNAHNKYNFGFIGGFHFLEEEMTGVKPIITEYNGVKIWEKPHIGGNFIIRREDFEAYKGEGQMGLSEYQWTFRDRGLKNGYLWPPIICDHMQDARSKHHHPEYKNKFGLGSADYLATFIRDSIPYLRENNVDN